MIYANMIQAITSQRDAARSGAIQEKLDAAGVQPAEKGPQLFQVAADISSSILPDATKEISFTLGRDRNVVDCSLRNRGSKQATEVMLKTPFDVEGAVVGDVGLPKESLIGKGVALGTVKPGDTFRLYMWTDHETITTWPGDNCLLTYAEGTGDVDVARQVYGAPATAAALVGFLIDTPLASLPLLVMLGLLFMSVGANLRQRYFAAGYRAAQEEVAAEPKLIEEESTRDDGGAA